MSTKALRELVEWVERGDSEMVGPAKAELEAIEKAASDITALTPGEVVKEFEANPRNPLVGKWMGAAEFFAVLAGRMKMP